MTNAYAQINGFVLSAVSGCSKVDELKMCVVKDTTFVKDCTKITKLTECPKIGAQYGAPSFILLAVCPA